MPESIRIDEPHLRRCWSCGTTNEHQSRIVPGVLCPNCGSQDTRAVEEKVMPESKRTAGKVIVGVSGHSIRTEGTGALLGNVDRAEDAAFIAKAWNAHDELLAALRMARRMMQNEWHNKPRIGMEEACAAADAAILLATA